MTFLRKVSRTLHLYINASKAANMKFEELSEEEILDIAILIMDNLMDASTKIDHQRHVRDFTDRLKKIVTQDYLIEVCERYQKEKGYFDNRDVIAVFRRPNSAIIIWKQTFTKISGEYLAEMLLVYHEGRYLVDHTWVI